MPTSCHFVVRARRASAGALVAAAAIAAPTTPDAVSAGSTITVTTTGDELDINGTCSLREAVLSANLDQAVDACPAGSGADTIAVPAGTYVLAIPGAGEADGRTGDLDMSQDVIVDGRGAVIDGAGLDRVFEIHAGAAVTMNGLTARGGYVLSDIGGGIHNAGTLTADDVTVTANTGDLGDLGPSEGAGIGNDGTLTLLGSRVVDNVFGQIYPAGSGGGVFNRGTLTVRDSTIAGNAAWERGGGVWNSGIAAISTSTVSGNGTGCYECASDGGGVYNSGTLTVENSTITDNGAGGGDYSPSASGGALFTSGTASLLNVTIAGNVVSALCDTHCFATPVGGGVAVASGGSATLLDSIVGDNSVRQDQSVPNGGGSVTSPSACAGSVTSGGYNLVDTTAGCGYQASPTDLIGVDPELGPLQDNGGPTPTRSLLPGSPAIDAANPTLPGGGGGACAAGDQRGVVRPQDGDGDGVALCDIGAVELEAQPNTAVEVVVDVKPGSQTNPINLRSKGSIPVAVLSGATFDATTIDVSSVTFGSGGATAKRPSVQDVNGDRRLDLVLHFALASAGIRPGDQRVCLVGVTSADTALHGCDSIHIVPMRVSHGSA